jgi:predicted nicotinamide N-methyase
MTTMTMSINSPSSDSIATPQGLSDNLMNQLTSLLASSLPSEVTSAQQKSYVTYTLPHVSTPASPAEHAPTLTLHESRFIFASSGTTGLRTWESSLHLGNHLLHNPSLIASKSILELGAGTGYVSLLCAKYLHASHVIATDISPEVISSIETNIYLNDLQDTSLIAAKPLAWGHPLLGTESESWNDGLKIDIVLGADLTYDSNGIPALVATFLDLFSLFPEVKVLIAAPIRNENTFDIFSRRCNMMGFGVREVEFPMLETERHDGPFYSDMVPIKLCFIEKEQ